MMYPFNLEYAFRNLLKVSSAKGAGEHKGYIVSFSEETLVWTDTSNSVSVLRMIF